MDQKALLQGGGWALLISGLDAGVRAKGTLYDPEKSVFAKIERFRSKGLDILTAIDLAADQFGVDPTSLAQAHFAWLLDGYGG